ncbi:UDP-N-acetylglucosamine 2-epimerase (non-hydrolyzing) [Candidatus Peribacteria bacterium]|nr:UDP-N-acetylglucosamine 2-epimerase (non-hydrolyzing) [Candidatus Peribacteria bacterium]
MITVLSSASARPNFVKLAAVHHALSKHKDIRHIIVHTGQHYDPLLSDIFFTQLGIPEPDSNLGVRGGDREEVIDSTMIAMELALEKYKPDIVLVYGDVNGAVGAARAAKNAGIRLGHVEAGLRSFDVLMPEELNRIEIDQLADELFVTEQSGIDNLGVEGMKGNVHFVGNTMIDTLIRMMPQIDAVTLAPELPERFAIVTLHRPSNVDDRDVLIANFEFLKDIAKYIPVLLPAHPRLAAALQKAGIDPKKLVSLGIFITESFGYLQFLHLLKHAAFVLTDSGGIQEEAVLLRKRCFTMRRNTERPSTIDSGSNVLIDPNVSSDRTKVLEFANNPVTLVIKIPEKWDGKAGERIAKILS